MADSSRWFLAVVVCSAVALDAAAQTAAPSAAEPVRLAAQVAKLGDFDYATRTAAARAIRRAPAAEAGPVLTAAITTSLDSYVRFRAFVLLTGLLDPRLEDFARAALIDKNDRLRQAALDWLERNPVPALAPRLIQLVETEQAEFVRPSLLRALAALDADPVVRTSLTREVSRGLDIFRGAVIEAIGLRRGVYAREAIAQVMANQGPLRGVAALALARIGGPEAEAALASVKDKNAGVELVLRVSEAIAAGKMQEGRAAVQRTWPSSAEMGIADEIARLLGLLAERGDEVAVSMLVEAGVAGARDLRDHAAVALGIFALRMPEALLAWMAGHEAQRDGVLALVKDGFDLLEEDVAEEAFYASVRASYWKAADGSPVRASAAALIDGLEF
jgi:HEAT repeat protein